MLVLLIGGIALGGVFGGYLPEKLGMPEITEAVDDRLNVIIKGEYQTLIEGGDQICVTPENKAFTQKYAAPVWSPPAITTVPTYLYPIYPCIAHVFGSAERSQRSFTGSLFGHQPGAPARESSPLISCLSQEELRPAIRDQRCKEFHGEGIRWFDLKRGGILETVIDANVNLDQNEGY